MKELAAYMMVRLAGNETPTADDVTKVLASMEVEADSDALSKLMSALEGKDIDALIEAGKDKLSKFGGGGGGGGGAGGAGAAEEAKEEEEEEEEEEELDMGGGGGLFGDDDGGADY